jgi:hypothetical protein
MPPRRLQGHKVGLELAESTTDRQGRSLGCFCLPDSLAVLSDQQASLGVQDHLLFVGVPTQEARSSGKGKLLGEEAGPLLQTPGNDHAAVFGQHRGEREEVGSTGLAGTELLRQTQDSQTTGDLEVVFAVQDHLACWADVLAGACQRLIEEFPLPAEQRTHDLPSLVSGVRLQTVDAL